MGYRQKVKIKITGGYMSGFIKLQKFIFDTLKNSALSAEVKVFNQVPKNTPFPYIFLGKFYISDNSLKDLTRFLSIYEIHLYSREASIDKILGWISEIRQSLSVKKVDLSGFWIEEMSFMETVVDVMADGKTHKAITKFRIHTRGGNANI